MNVMVMSYENVPMVFQGVMNKVLRGLIGKDVEMYLDDILVHAKTKGEHGTLMEKVFMRLERNNTKINKKKIQFSWKEMKLL
jgi:hypothetical protein